MVNGDDIAFSRCRVLLVRRKSDVFCVVRPICRSWRGQRCKQKSCKNRFLDHSSSNSAMPVVVSSDSYGMRVREQVNLLCLPLPESIGSMPSESVGIKPRQSVVMREIPRLLHNIAVFNP